MRRQPERKEHWGQVYDGMDNSRVMASVRVALEQHGSMHLAHHHLEE